MPRVAAPASPLLDAIWHAEVDDYVVAAGWSNPAGLLAVALGSGPIVLFDREGRRLVSLAGHKVGTSSISWSADGRFLVSGGQDGHVRVWDATAGACVADAEAGAAWVECVACSPVGEVFASAAGRTLRLWSLRGEALRRYPDHPSTIADLRWQRTAPYFATACYGQLAVFSADSDKPAKRFTWKGSILAVAWSPDGNYAATGNQDATVHFWYRKSGKDLEMSGYPAKVRELSWDGSSRYLATGGSSSPIVWDCAGKGPAGSKPIQLDGHRDLLTSLAYQWTGPLLASGARDGEVHVWHPTRGERATGRFTMGGPITALCWSPDDRVLAATSGGGRVVVLAAPSTL